MNKKAQKDLCIAIKENDLIAFQKAMTQGADISGPIENKKIEADFKELCQKHITPTATHMAILYARRKDKINILRDIHRNPK